MRLEGWHLIIIIVLVLVLFAAPKLPGMARSLGQSMRIFKSEVREMRTDGPPVKDPAETGAVEGTTVTPPTSTGAEGRTGGGRGVPPPDRA
ncbi:sec-independent protein translocase protein TatA [Arthrobacter sp. UYCu512]|uniref:Sec-independent protein translocase subunit TatA n=1 Tax=Arthrobacter sp. UYCu512 TaxID=3156338 RepID=UPI003393C503